MRDTRYHGGDPLYGASSAIDVLDAHTELMHVEQPRWLRVVRDEHRDLNAEFSLVDAMPVHPSRDKGWR